MVRNESMNQGRKLMASGATLHRWIGGVALAAGLLTTGIAGAQVPTPALVSSDHAAGLIMFPKVVSDPAGVLSNGIPRDTLIQLTNTDSTQRSAHCYYVDATPRCTTGISRIDPITGVCRDNNDCTNGATCDPDWGAVDFDVTLTPNQPIGWLASSGLTRDGICSGGDRTGQECDVLGGPPLDCPGGGTCVSLSPPLGEVPARPGVFVGELKCIQVDGVLTLLPVNRNDLIGEAAIYDVNQTNVDVRAYNAIGIQAVSSNSATQADTTLCLGATTGSAECPVAEYAQCPSVLILDHFFDSATVSPGTTVNTEVTFVPCTENFENGRDPIVDSLQLLVFNEFEQRFSASTRVQCFREVGLSNIDRFPGQEATSIFNVAVQGTLTGQTRIRTVPGSETDAGHGVLAIAEEFRTSEATRKSSAFNVNYVGTNAGRGDFVRYVAQGTP